MDINQKFVLGEKLSADQIEYFDEFGFIHFANFIDASIVQRLISSMEEVEKTWIENGVEKINGIPIRYGQDENGKQIVQRFAFASLCNDYLHAFINDKRFEILKEFIGNESRVAENEKDGMVINHYVNTKVSRYTKLGWHTDSLRDIFQGLQVGPMLNIGISLDDSFKEKGGLRVIPGSHRQNFWSMLFRKRYFIDNTPDKDEHIIETKAGDLTVHNGRIWHRVALSTVEGLASKRRMIYFPIISGKFKPKNGKTPTPIYHRLQKVVR